MISCLSSVASSLGTTAIVLACNTDVHHAPCKLLACLCLLASATLGTSICSRERGELLCLVP